MTTRMMLEVREDTGLATAQWLWIGFQASAGSITAVLLVQGVLLALWPELAAFKPLDSYARSALFTLIPSLGATAVFAWLARNKDRFVSIFIGIAGGFLLLSVLPDYLLPLPEKSIAASTAAAILHLVAGMVTVALILSGYRRALQGSSEA